MHEQSSTVAAAEGDHCSRKIILRTYSLNIQFVGIVGWYGLNVGGTASGYWGLQFIG